MTCHSGILAMTGIAALILAATSLCHSQAVLAPADGGLVVENGRLAIGGRAVWGFGSHNGWWGQYRPNLTRNDTGETGLLYAENPVVGLNHTEDLAAYADHMRRFGCPAHYHNFGLWYDRRRDRHDQDARTDANVEPALLEQPWARSEQGTAWDGLPRYDLTRFNPWYFDRLGQFAALCDRRGAVLFHCFYMQHALLETNAHYVDFPWRPTNCIQKTGMPDRNPAANAFYDVTHPLRRDLHTRYIRHCLDVLGPYRNVVHFIGEEYTGDATFVAFWIETILQWERDHGAEGRIKIGLHAPKDVTEAILAESNYRDRIFVIDLSDWWYRPDGTLHAVRGGKEVPGRNYAGYEKAEDSTPEQVYRQTREIREAYPHKAITQHLIQPVRRQHREADLLAARQYLWALLMAGNSIQFERLEYATHQPEEGYDAVPRSFPVIEHTYAFVTEHLAESLLRMAPAEIAAANVGSAWSLAEPGTEYLIYASVGGGLTVDLAGAGAGAFEATWFNPRTGKFTAAGTLPGGSTSKIDCPSERQDWALWLRRPSARGGR